MNFQDAKHIQIEVQNAFSKANWLNVFNMHLFVDEWELNIFSEW